MRKLLIIDAAALSWSIARGQATWDFREIAPPFPAVTSPVQAAFRTASEATEHRLVSNGLFFPELRKVLFWEQSAALVHGPRIWKRFRERGGKVGMMFWQQSLGESVDLVLSPAPIHKHSGGMIQDCYAEPRHLQERLAEKIGRSFNLMHYWGPLASQKSSEWITEATCAVMEMSEFAPDLLLTYLPHLDYDLQRHGPDSAEAGAAARVLFELLGTLRTRAEAAGYDWVIFGDYAIEQVTGGAVFPNRLLREAGLFRTRSIKGMEYADFFTSRAFAIVDHQIAHVHVAEPEAKSAARDALRDCCEIEEFGPGLLLVAKPGTWFAYPWWSKRSEAPDFATHVDIHNKPGYDPCELFWGWPPPSVSMDTSKVRGTHGRIDPALNVAWAASFPLDREPRTLLDLAEAIRARLESSR
jgi:predicted AlkP superfamily pyrophosphatase or phosphodiesterase